MAEPTPEPIQELIAGYVLGNLTPEEAEQLRQLLATHPEMANEVHQLQEVLAAIPYSLPEVAPPESLRSATLQAVQQPRQHSRENQRRSPVVLALGSVAALLVLAFGLDNVRLRQQLTTAQAEVAQQNDLVVQQKDLIAMLQESKTQLVSLKGMDQRSSASGNIVMMPGHTGIILVLQNLPPLPPGKFYQLWAITGNKKHACGNFEANLQGTVFVKMPISATSEVKTMAITVETTPTPEQPKGPMIMTSRL